MGGARSSDSFARMPSGCRAKADDEDDIAAYKILPGRLLSDTMIGLVLRLLDLIGIDGEPETEMDNSKRL